MIQNDSTTEISYTSLDEIFSSYPDPEPENKEPEALEPNATVEDAIIPDKPEMTPGMIEHIQNPPFIFDMIRKIEAVDAYAWSRGKTGLDFGFDNLNKAFNGLNTGLILFAGGSNTGKGLTN